MESAKKQFKLLNLLLLASLMVDVIIAACPETTTCSYTQSKKSALSDDKCHWVAEGTLSGLSTTNEYIVYIKSKDPSFTMYRTFCTLSLNEETCTDELVGYCGCKKSSTGDWDLRFGDVILEPENATNPFEYKVEALCIEESATATANRTECTTPKNRPKIDTNLQEPQAMKVKCTADGDEIQLEGPDGYYQRNSWAVTLEFKKQKVQLEIECCVESQDSDVPLHDSKLLKWYDLRTTSLASESEAWCLKYLYRADRDRKDTTNKDTIYFDYQEKGKCSRAGQVTVDITGLPSEDEWLIISHQRDNSYGNYKTIAMYATIGAFFVGAFGTMVYGAVHVRMNNQLTVLDGMDTKKSSGTDLQPDASHEAIVDSRDAMEMMEENFDEDI